MESYQLAEHAKQINDAIAAFIETQAMISENKQRELNGESMAYTEEAFRKVMELYELGYNSNIEKIRRFYP